MSEKSIRHGHLNFPYKEVMEDCAGNKRTFVIHANESPIGGYSLVAEEAVENESDDGYLFEYQERTLSIIFESFYALPVIMK